VIGEFHRHGIWARPYDSARFEGSANASQFNGLAMRLLRSAGYAATAYDARVISSKPSPESALSMSVLVTRIWTDTIVRSHRRRDENYQNATIEGRVRVLRPGTADWLYDAHFIGYGRDQNVNPTAVPVAFGNLLERALSDPEFVRATKPD
jgi:hypothetical protein